MTPELARDEQTVGRPGAQRQEQRCSGPGLDGVDKPYGRLDLMRFTPAGWGTNQIHSGRRVRGERQDLAIRARGWVSSEEMHDKSNFSSELRSVRGALISVHPGGVGVYKRCA